MEQINENDYKTIINEAVHSISPFKITFKGVTASSSCILIQGFPEDSQLNNLRKDLRNRFKQTDLPHSMDKRYQLQTAHLTVLRLKQPLDKPETFIKRVANLRETNFGSYLVGELELVGNDWYQQKEKVKRIHTFRS